MPEHAGGATNLTAGTDGYHPAWSPDGGKIAFTTDFERISVMDADGSNVTRLTNGPEVAFGWSWACAAP